MHDVAWRGMWICVRNKEAQKQLARTSLNHALRKGLGGGGSLFSTERLKRARETEEEKNKR